MKFTSLLEEQKKEGQGIVQKYNDWLHDKCEAPQDSQFKKWLDEHTVTTATLAYELALEEVGKEARQMKEYLIAIGKMPYFREFQERQQTHIAQLKETTKE